MRYRFSGSFAGLLCLTCTAAAWGQIPGPPQDQPVVLQNATIHPVTGPVISQGSLVFADGRIVAVGTKVAPPPDARRIDVAGKHVYPGFIEAHSQIGLVEIPSVRATRDQSETGDLNPNVRAHVSVNPDSEIIPVTRANGVLIALSAPSGGRISGQASVMQLDGWTYEDMILKPSAVMMVNWPSPGSDRISPELKTLRQLFNDARTWQSAHAAHAAGADTTQPLDLRLQALQPVLQRTQPLMVHADEVRAIQAAVAFAAEQNVRLIIFGGHDAELCADLLKQHAVPVVISAVHRNPRRRHEAFDTAYTLPLRLQQAGLQFCISGSDRESTWNARNLPYHAATAAAYGLPREEALKAVTLYPAQILGIDEQVGSLQVGKDATLFITDQDPLETAAQVQRAWVQGREVDLTSRHTRLYDRYRTKYQQQDR